MNWGQAVALIVCVLVVVAYFAPVWSSTPEPKPEPEPTPQLPPGRGYWEQTPEARASAEAFARHLYEALGVPWEEAVDEETLLYALEHEAGIDMPPLPPKEG